MTRRYASPEFDGQPAAPARASIENHTVVNLMGAGIDANAALNRRTAPSTLDGSTTRRALAAIRVEEPSTWSGGVRVSNIEYAGAFSSQSNGVE